MANDEPDEKGIESVRDYLVRAWKIHEQRDAAPYDGVLGILPDWVPDWHREQFKHIRNRLLDTPLFGEKLSPAQLMAGQFVVSVLKELEWQA